jgi:predicted DCC family thiol-disulfide oxidoreductase YuxK
LSEIKYYFYHILLCSNKAINQCVIYIQNCLFRMKTRLLYLLPDDLAKRQPLVLFDGDCNMCNQSVQFLLKNNPRKDLNFTSLQSVSAGIILAISGKAFQQADTVLFLQGNVLSGKSTAALNISSHLGFPWQILLIFRIVPLSIRDAVYGFIAKNRYKWFGKKTSCWLTNEFSDRFLN